MAKRRTTSFFKRCGDGPPPRGSGLHADRWAIEETFKNSKQHLGVQQTHAYKAQGHERAFGLSLWLYLMAWQWYLTQKPKQRCFLVQPWCCQKTTPNFADALDCFRCQLLRERIHCMLGKLAINDKEFEVYQSVLNGRIAGR